jgi:hypothetical protein
MTCSRPKSKPDNDAPPPRPRALPVVPEAIPAELKALPRWNLWRYELRGDDWTKPPFAIDGRPASSTDPATLARFEDVLDAYERGGWDGLGLVPLPDDNLAGIDLDGCRSPETGAVEPWAAAVVARMDSYSEASPSGRGLRIFCRGRKPDRQRSRKGRVEIYDGQSADGSPGGRYLTLTGHRLPDVPAEVCERQEQLSAVYEELLKGKKPGGSDDPPPGGNGHGDPFRQRARWSIPNRDLTDDEVVRVAEEGHDNKLSLLWRGDTTGHDDDDSRADAALCAKLLFWIGGPDRSRLDGLFRRSGLMRPKWDEKRGHTTYGGMTLSYALGVQTEYRRPGRSDGHGDDTATAHDLILAHFRDTYRPAFRRGPAIYSEAFAREVERSEAVNTPDIAIITTLEDAADAPRKRGEVIRGALPALFGRWSKVAWGTLLGRLPDEPAAEEVTPNAEEDFRRRLGQALLRPITAGETIFGQRVGADFRSAPTETTRTERRPILHFAVRETSHLWRQVHGYCLWSRLAPGPDGHEALEVAVRLELFGQIGCNAFDGLSKTAFAHLCEHYGLGTAGKAHGRRAVVLTAEFVSSLLPDLNAPEGPEDLAGGEKRQTSDSVPDP